METAVANAIADWAKLADYTESQLVAEITSCDQNAQAMAAAVKQGSATALEFALRAGHALLEARQRCKHGQWSAWLEKNAPSISPDQDSRYRALAERTPHVRNLDEIRTIREAYIACGIIKGSTKSSAATVAPASKPKQILAASRRLRLSVQKLLDVGSPDLPPKLRSDLTDEIRDLISVLKLLTAGPNKTKR